MKNMFSCQSENYLNMAFDSKRIARLEKPDGYGCRKGDCGDSIEMFLTISNNTIDHVNFDIDGCLNTRACANTVACLVEGKTINDAWEISPESVINFLQTLPEGETHCAELAVSTLYQALVNYQQNCQKIWKKQYQKRL